jgi:integrase
MSIRKRTWTTKTGESKEAWIVDYTAGDGSRHIQTFPRKKDADDFAATVKVDVRRGVHTPHSTSLTVAQAAQAWIDFVRLEGRERSTVEYYQSHIDLHINPRLGGEKLSKLTTPRIQAFRDDLVANPSRAQARKVLVSLKSLFGRRKTPGHDRSERRRGRICESWGAGQKETQGGCRYSHPG